MKVPAVVKQVRVCKRAFASIHGITLCRVNRAHANKTASNVPIKDRRGKYGHHNQVSRDKKFKVLKHIGSFPTITSHYSRKTCPHVKYLESQIEAKSHMYELYKEWLDENYKDEEKIPVTQSYYENMLKTHFPHLKIYIPRKDTCRICDNYFHKSKESGLTTEERKALDHMHEVHKIRADEGYKLPKKILEICK